MATARTKENIAYCDDVVSEMAYMIQNIHDLREQAAKTFGRESEAFRVRDRHLGELAEYMDWKLQILATACPFEWQGIGDTVESVVSVRISDGPAEEYSGGYLGG